MVGQAVFSFATSKGGGAHFEIVAR